MKALKRSRYVGIHCAMLLSISGAISFASSLLAAQAQETNTVSPATAEAAAPAVSKAAPSPAEIAAKPEPSPNLHSPGVEELLKLAEAKVSKDVMLKFVATSDLVTYPTASELVAMKKGDVPDEVIVAFLDRGAVLLKGARAIEQDRRVAAPAIVSALSTEGEMDPDSYEFWWYHYAYPRALSYSYKTLTPYLPDYYYNTYPIRSGGSRYQPYSSRYNSGRPPLSSSRVPYGTLPPTAGRHSSFSVPSSTVTLRRHGGR